MFCASPNFLSQPKNLTAVSASSKTYMPTQNILELVKGQGIYLKKWAADKKDNVIIGQMSGIQTNVYGRVLEQKEWSTTTAVIYGINLQSQVIHYNMHNWRDKSQPFSPFKIRCKSKQ